MTAYQIFERKYIRLKSVKVPITSFMFMAHNGGNIDCTATVVFTRSALSVRHTISIISVKLCEMRYTITETRIVRICDIKLEKKNTSARSISNFRKVNNNDHNIRWVMTTPSNHNTAKNKSACNNTMRPIVAEKPKNFPRINSYRAIGLESIKKIVFHSISLNKSWDPTNSTQIIPKVSIMASQKSTTTFSLSQSVSCPRLRENNKNIKAKNKIIYKNLFRTISLNVFIAIFNISSKTYNLKNLCSHL